MFRLTHDITIGKYRLKLVDSVSIKCSVETLSDTAVITLPGSVMNATLQIEGKINVGDAVSIRLGYDSELKEEFAGYVEKISTNDGSLKIECLDALYLFKKTALKNSQYKPITLAALLRKVCAEVDSSIKVNCDYSFTYDDFVIYKANGYDVLKKVHEDTKADIYFAGNTLHVHMPYTQNADTTPVRFDFSRNIEKSDLTYRKAEDHKVEVEVKFSTAKDNGKTVTFGTKGGEKISLKSPAQNEADAMKVAEAEYRRRSFDGYEGSFTAWLIPYVKPTNTVHLHDKDYPTKDGNYYVTGTETTYSSSGGVRKIKLGHRLS